MDIEQHTIKNITIFYKRLWVLQNLNLYWNEFNWCDSVVYFIKLYTFKENNTTFEFRNLGIEQTCLFKTRVNF